MWKIELLFKFSKVFNWENCNNIDKILTNKNSYVKLRNAIIFSLAFFFKKKICFGYNVYSLFKVSNNI